MFPVPTQQLQTVRHSFPIVLQFSLLGPMSASFRLNTTHKLMIQGLRKFVLYIEGLLYRTPRFYEFSKNNQNVRYIEVKLIINLQNQHSRV